ncbi:hypothetical protein Hamer_G008560 [Homarus americanus]|uniref:Uncharacterized protein n=1 Tax=Homarus americanus TaxID=6706 RepID=A0A8J5T4X9_HOMAM|nr:hypothetical protein Hamer_G008560 [Homarus americanus]
MVDCLCFEGGQMIDVVDVINGEENRRATRNFITFLTPKWCIDLSVLIIHPEPDPQRTPMALERPDGP